MKTKLALALVSLLLAACASVGVKHGTLRGQKQVWVYADRAGQYQETWALIWNRGLQYEYSKTYYVIPPTPP